LHANNHNANWTPQQGHAHIGDHGHSHGDFLDTAIQTANDSEEKHTVGETVIYFYRLFTFITTQSAIYRHDTSSQTGMTIYDSKKTNSNPSLN
jgi:hypothetical protein